MGQDRQVDTGIKPSLATHCPHVPWNGRSGLGWKPLQGGSVHGGTVTSMYVDESLHSRPSISPPFTLVISCGFVTSLAFFLYTLSPTCSASFDLPPTSEGCTYVFYLYSWTERRLVSILPWALKIDSAKSNEYYLPSSRSDLNSMRGLETLLELEIPYSKCVFCISAPK